MINQHPYLNWLGQPSRKLSVAVSIASFKLLLAASHPPLPWYSAGTVEPAGAGAGAGAGARESKIARSKRAPRATWWRETVARNCRLRSRTRIPFEEKEFAEGPGGLEPARGIAFRARWTISTILYGKTQRPCQNDALNNGTCETRLRSPEQLANPGERRPSQRDTCRRGCDHESVVCAAQRTHADECCGHAGVQRVMCCVREVRKQHPACIVTLEGRLQQRRERVDGADAAAEGPRASLVCSRHVQTKSSRL